MRDHGKGEYRMKKLVKRRRNFRVNNPLAFGILCAMILVLVAGVTYALAAGVVAPAVRSIQLASATPTPTPTEAPATPSPSPQTVSAEGEPTVEATPETSSVPEAEATPSPTPQPQGALSGHTIGVDPARSFKSTKKGVATNIYANRLNYAVATLVKEKLEAQGATVVFTLSDVKDEKDSAARASALNKGGVEMAIRLECNLTDNADTRGAIAWVPEKHALQSDCEKLASAVLKAYIEETGLSIAKFNGSSIRKKTGDTPMEQIEAPNCMLIMGYISNDKEDRLLNDSEYQDRMAAGIVAGIKSYFGV